MSDALCFVTFGWSTFVELFFLNTPCLVARYRVFLACFSEQTIGEVFFRFGEDRRGTFCFVNSLGVFFFSSFPIILCFVCLWRAVFSYIFLSTTGFYFFYCFFFFFFFFFFYFLGRIWGEKFLPIFLWVRCALFLLEEFLCVRVCLGGGGTFSFVTL